MLLHREYLVYRSMRFLVSFEGEPGKGTEDSQNLRMTILSATPGKPRDLETKEIAGTIDEAKHQIRDSLSSEDGHGQWERFMLRPEPDGTFSGPGFLAETMMPLVYKYGVEGLRERLKTEREPEIVALCGGPHDGLDNAIAVLTYCEKYVVPEQRVAAPRAKCHSDL